MGWEREQMEVEKGGVSYKEKKCSMGIKGSGHYSRKRAEHGVKTIKLICIFSPKYTGYEGHVC